MSASQTVLPFKLAASEESLTAHAGLALFGEYLRAMGVARLIDHELPRIRAEEFHDSKKTQVLKKVALIGRFSRFTWRVR